LKAGRERSETIEYVGGRLDVAVEECSRVRWESITGRGSCVSDDSPEAYFR
jgi:hypothetical protein